MSSQVRALLAVALATLILVGAQYLLPRSPEEESPAPVEEKAVPVTAKPSTSPSSETPTPSLNRLHGQEAPPKAPEREAIVETDVVRAVFTSRGGALKGWQLKAYRVADGQSVDLVAAQQGDQRDQFGPLAVSSGSPEEPAPLDFDIDKPQLTLGSSSETGSITFSSRGSGPLQLSKRLTFKANSYRVEVELLWKNTGKQPITIAPELAWGPGFYGDQRLRPQPPTAWVDGRRVTDDLGSLQDIATHKGQVSWIALQNLYFAAALLPGDKGSIATVRKGPQEQPVISLVAPTQSLPPGEQLIQRFALYGGPKDLDHLKAAGSDLSNIVDLGWFDTLARPALHLLRFLYRLSGNYGVAIILISILQKVALHPLTAKSLRSMQAMKSLQPKIAAISERYKNNPQKKQQEVMGLYRKHGVNPLGGCLPMLIQIPIFVALYNALSSSVEMWRAPFLWIKDLSQPDALFTVDVWGLKDYPFNLLALFMGVSMFFQQKMSPPASSDPQQAKLMLYMMPIMFVFMFWTFPSGLVLYWLVNNVLQMGQQHWLQKRGKLALGGPEAT